MLSIITINLIKFGVMATDAPSSTIFNFGEGFLFVQEKTNINMFAFSMDIITELANTNSNSRLRSPSKKGGTYMKKFMVLMHLISGTFAASFVLYFVRKNSSEHRRIMMSIIGTQLLSWVFLLIRSIIEKAKP
ncbi:hypothetical protein RCG17_01240 [Neobacillus sp. PS3-12]|uniref:hypothetical protein n=1 Tax=Neobacillus sp. PS3-12 TaxID=3070677 RepID=UPI0027E03893|nr:hypothetical protein [Neobacillus sp. PS3-12]WML53362.1 hypothetical protein RCG17_01240 [Neobacillus sp. PS3-12]